MNLLNVGLGVAAILYGIYTLIVRVKAPEKLGKLTAMREKLGTAGQLIHVIAYTVAPLLLGFALLFAGLQGVSLI